VSLDCHEVPQPACLALLRLKKGRKFQIAFEFLVAPDDSEGAKFVFVLQATAALYNLLGLPEHYAMELFVEYKPQ
jgi:hypothetical protein